MRGTMLGPGLFCPSKCEAILLGLENHLTKARGCKFIVVSFSVPPWKSRSRTMAWGFVLTYCSTFPCNIYFWQWGYFLLIPMKYFRGNQELDNTELKPTGAPRRAGSPQSPRLPHPASLSRYCGWSEKNRPWCPFAFSQVKAVINLIYWSAKLSTLIFLKTKQKREKSLFRIESLAWTQCWTLFTQGQQIRRLKLHLTL